MDNQLKKFEGKASVQQELVGELRSVLEQDFRHHLSKMDGFLDLLSIQLEGKLDDELGFTLDVLRNCLVRLNSGILKFNRIMDEEAENVFRSRVS